MTRDAADQPSGEAPREGGGPLPQPGEIFDGKYRIERAIGQGAMAVVFEATHLQLEDRVAIKLLLPQWAEDPGLVERFMREGRAATRIRSEHVVRVFDVGVTGGRPYLVMEYLDGSDLDQVLAQGGPLPVAVAVDYLLQACEAIAEAHVRGIVHRDLKPANLFLTRRADASACVKVLDFGISKANEGLRPDTRTTAPSTVMGSPHYMSPEQMVSSTDVDARSDVWALGAILHELLIGSPAFDGETMAALSAAVLRDPAPPLTALRGDVPPAVEAAVLRCLEKEPSRRFANVAELAGALAEHGSASARASAERIARVLDGGTGKISIPIARLPEPRTARAASLLASSIVPARARGRVLGYVVAAAALVGVTSGIAWMVVKNDRAFRAAEEREHASPAASGSVVPSLTSGAGAAAGTAPTGTAMAPAPVASASPPVAAEGNGREQAGTPGAPQASHSPALARPATHARGPRHGQRTPPSRVPPPLPDFPVPSADPEGEPSSRPILAAPPPATTAATVPPALPPPPSSSLPPATK